MHTQRQQNRLGAARFQFQGSARPSRDATERHQLTQHNRFKHMFNAARNGVGACSRWLLQTRLARFGLARLEFEFSEQGALAMRQTCPPETAVLINHTAANTRQARRAL